MDRQIRVAGNHDRHIQRPTLINTAHSRQRRLEQVKNLRLERLQCRRIDARGAATRSSG